MTDPQKHVFPTDLFMQDGYGNLFQYGQEEGMTLREYYAGLAMQAVIGRKDLAPNELEIDEQVAAEAVGFADALIAALTRHPCP